jgi:hypothetical protein
MSDKAIQKGWAKKGWSEYCPRCGEKPPVATKGPCSPCLAEEAGAVRICASVAVLPKYWVNQSPDDISDAGRVMRGWALALREEAERLELLASEFVVYAQNADADAEAAVAHALMGEVPPPVLELRPSPNKGDWEDELVVVNLPPALARRLAQHTYLAEGPEAPDGDAT